MNLDRFVLGFAGFMVLLRPCSSACGCTTTGSSHGLVGLNLLQSSITGLCPAAIAARKLGVAPGQAFR